MLIRPSGLADTRYTEWDTQTGSVTSLTLPPAITYRWSSGGALIVPNQDAQSPTPDASPTGTTLAPVGVLNRNAEFTVWQPGDLTYMVQNSQGQLEPPGAYSWTTSRLAWSPDGRYLLSLDDKTARIQPAGQTPPTQQALADFGLANAPVLPVRDAGLQAILAAMPANTADRFTQSLRLAWRPDGKVVAVQPRFYRDDRAVSQHAVTLYDCETGRKLATLLPHITMVHGAYGGNDGYLRWSADGSHLLLLDSALGPTTIWGPDQLPR